MHLHTIAIAAALSCSNKCMIVGEAKNYSASSMFIISSATPPISSGIVPGPLRMLKLDHKELWSLKQV